MRYLFFIALTGFYSANSWAQLEFVEPNKMVQSSQQKTECDDLSSDLSFQICTFELLEQIKIRNNQLNNSVFKIQTDQPLSGQRLESTAALDFSQISTYDFLTAAELNVQFLSADNDPNLVSMRYRYYGILNQILVSLDQIYHGENDVVVNTQNRARQVVGDIFGSSEPIKALVPTELREGQETLKYALRNYQRFQKDLTDYANSK